MFTEPVLQRDFHEIRLASSSAQSFQFSLSTASGFSSGIVVDLKTFKETSSLSVRPSVWVCSFVHLLLSPVGILQRHHGNTTERSLRNLHQRCQFLFLLKIINQLRLFFKRREGYWCKDCSGFYSSALCWVLFPSLLTNVFFIYVHLRWISQDWLGSGTRSSFSVFWYTVDVLL